MTDPRTYFRQWTSGGSTGENPIAPIGAGGDPGGVVSDYAQAVAATPGLMNWYRFGKTMPNAGTAQTATPPYFANSAGATTLRSFGGPPQLAPSLIANDPDPACDLNGGYLDAFDYRCFFATNEVFSAELWVNFRTLRQDVGIVGAWQNNNWISKQGWMIYTPNGTDIRLYTADTYFTAAGVLSAGKNIHIVGVWGGQQPPLPDYYSRIYVNGACVASNLSASSHTPNNESVRFQIGQYANGQGSSTLDGVVDEVAMYNRMLQPEEIAQHYQLGSGAE